MSKKVEKITEKSKMLLNKIKRRTIRVHVADLSALRYILLGACRTDDSFNMCHIKVELAAIEGNANAYLFKRCSLLLSH